MTQEVLFDRGLLRQNRKRALKNFAQHNFLHHEIANRIAENVEMLNRDFQNILEIGAMDDGLSKLVLSNSSGSYHFCDDEESLPIQPESFDLILSNLNLHYINQIPQFLSQIKSLLKSNGIFIASFFGEENLSQLVHVMHETENEIYGGISPRTPPTIDVKTAANLLSKVGFQNPISDFEKIEVNYSDPLNLLKDLKMMGQGNILTKRSRKFLTKNFLKKVSQNYRKMYSAADGNVSATFEIVTVAGWKK